MFKLPQSSCKISPKVALISQEDGVAKEGLIFEIVVQGRWIYDNNYEHYDWIQPSSMTIFSNLKIYSYNSLLNYWLEYN